MNAYRKLVTLFVFALTAAALSVGSASAQMNKTNVRGTFTLTFAAHWGSTTLPAGKYTFEAVGSGSPLIEVSGEAKGSPSAFILAQTYNPSPSANKSEMVCIRQGKIGVVRALVLTSLGETLYFAIPKNVRLYAHNGNAKTRTLLAQGPELIQRVPIEVAGL